MLNRRAGFRTGYIYKVKNNKEYSANSPVKGKYWIQLQLNGKRKRIALKNDNGDRIVDYDEAQLARKRIIAPLLIAERIAIMEFIKSSLLGLKEEERDANRVKDNELNNIQVNIKISVALDKYKKIRESEGLCKQHVATSCADCARFIDWITKNTTKIYLNEITTTDIKDYVDVECKSRTPKTFNNKIANIKRFFDVLMEQYKEQNVDYRNPVNKIKYKVLNSENQHSRRVLSDAELSRVLIEAKKVSDELYLLFLIGATTGLRLGDATTLNWSEIDLEAGVIRKIASKTKRYGVKQMIIGIVDILLEELIKIDNKTGYVLPNYVGYSRKKTISNKIILQTQNVFKQAGIETNEERKDRDNGKNTIVVAGYHSLRGTFISKHAELGTPLAIVQESVGHSNQTMTMHYTKIQEQKVRDAAKNFKIK